MTEQRESHLLDRKSLRKVVGQTANFSELAQDCVCFANGAGGRLLIGIEDDDDAPPPTQRVAPTLVDRIRKRVAELTVNVQVLPEMRRHDNGGDYIVVTVPRSVGVASTSDGRYFLRVGDGCQPVVGDDVLRLANERPSTPWESMTSLGLPVQKVDADKIAGWASGIRESDRVKPSVREKSDNELLEHYGLSSGGLLTNLGVLLVGSTSDRTKLGTAPLVQAIKYDDRGAKVAKWTWDDHRLSPTELVDAIWEELPDFRESYELPDGMFRTKVPAFEEAVVRELLVNALVHRPYTQRGDIFLNVHPDRLEVVNPGRLPLGVTPRNILHASRRRNDGLARVFHDLKLMEREGSGIDLMFERLLASGDPRRRSRRERTRSTSRFRVAWCSPVSFVCSPRPTSATSSRSVNGSSLRCSRRPRGSPRRSSPSDSSSPILRPFVRGSAASWSSDSSSRQGGPRPRGTLFRRPSSVKLGSTSGRRSPAFSRIACER